MPPNFLENRVMLCFERRCPKQNSVFRQELCIFAAPNFFAPPNFCAGYAISSRRRFFIIQNFEQLVLALKNRVILNAFTVLKCFYLQEFLSNLCLPWKTELALKFFTVLDIIFTFRIFEQLVPALKNRVCPDIFYCIERRYIFYPSGFFSNLRLAWKTECALNSLYWIYIFYHSKFWTTCDWPGTQSLPWIFYCNEIFFIFQDFWATCACPENKVCPDFFQARGGGCSSRPPASYATEHHRKSETWNWLPMQKLK